MARSADRRLKPGLHATPSEAARRIEWRHELGRHEASLLLLMVKRTLNQHSGRLNSS
jgi:hypothetical protein